MLRVLIQNRRVRVLFGHFIDPLIRLRPRRVVFVSKTRVQVMGNLRIMLDTLAEHGGYEIAVYKEGGILEETRKELSAKGIRVLDTYNFETLKYIYSSEQVVVSHSVRDAYISVHKRRRRIINLWHGVALKKIEGLMDSYGDSNEFYKRQKLIAKNALLYDDIIAANGIDRLVNALAFRVPYEKTHATGLPRFDYLKPGYVWPQDLLKQKQRLESNVAGRKLIVYAPTFREHGARLTELLDSKNVSLLADFCAQNGVVIGIRPHPYQSLSLDEICDGNHIINLSSSLIAETAVFLSMTDILIADYSSIWVDFLLRYKPILGFMPDFEQYMHKERGFIYEFNSTFPGPMLTSWRDVIEQLFPLLNGELSEDTRKRYDCLLSTLMLPNEMNRLSSTACLDLICNHKS